MCHHTVLRKHENVMNFQIELCGESVGRASLETTPTRNGWWAGPKPLVGVAWVVEEIN